ncbi:MAG TPA: type I-E CRISPR-associated protein Cas7/Cse4/CasC [Terriglobia bacterium]|nr:type I-E CRISPR-associated protein Cas7/Cse4/CasC [Terriglobia bacterium]HUZ46207.1 type I-E CRISPR-associated protein Cas7/Cse4/CasC [Terriglobia bacterium]
MLIEIHAIQNHSPANLNRDDLGAPKTCYFGGVLRSRISSQCLKRSIRMSDEFKQLLGAKRTRRLAQLIAPGGPDSGAFEKAMTILELCGIAPKEKKGKKGDDGDSVADDKSAGLVYVSKQAINEMAELLKSNASKNDHELAKQFAEIIARHTNAPDMALCGRMLEPKKAKMGSQEEAGEKPKGGDVWKGLKTTVEAALQVAHAISTHAARPEVDYYVAADDVPGEDAGAGFVDEAMFGSACFYKYFSIDFETLIKNLKGNKELAAHTVGAFIRGAALVNPTGKQNSFAAHNPPDGMLVEIRNTPLSYANAFAKAVTQDERDIISQSVAQLGQYIHDIDTGYGKPTKRFWFSPNLRYPLTIVEDNKEIPVAGNNIRSLDELIRAVVKETGHDWEEVQKVVVNSEVA